MVPHPRDIEVPEDFQLPRVFEGSTYMAKAAGVLIRLIQVNRGDWSYVLSTPEVQLFLEGRVSDEDERTRIYRGVLALGAQSYFSNVRGGFRLAESFKSLFQT